MRKQVADASAILAVLLDEPTAGAVREAAQERELISPGSLPWEIGNALVLGIRKGRLTVETATQVLREYEEIPLRITHIDRAEALTIAVAEGVYAYDAYMLACAHRHSAPLLTLDLQLRSVARQRDVALRPKAIDGDERYE